MKNKDLISIIVPAYNVEKYILKCISSIREQTYDNLQIIIVNDGSSDNTLEIIKKIESVDHRIQVINKKNEGVSVARNMGMEKALGKYICFVDGDDYIDNTMIETLYNDIISYESEMSICGYKNVFKNGTNNECSLYSKKEFLTSKQYLKKMSQYLYTVYYGSLCNKLYIRNIIVSNNIQFKKDICLAEDLLFNLDYIKFVKSIVVNPETLYFYYQDSEDSLTKQDDIDYLWEMAKIRLRYCADIYKEVGLYEECRCNISTALANEIISPTYEIVSGSQTTKEIAHKLKNMYSDGFVKQALKETNNLTSMHYIAKVALFFDNYYLFAWLMKMLIKVKNINANIDRN